MTRSRGGVHKHSSVIDCRGKAMPPRLAHCACEQRIVRVVRENGTYLSVVGAAATGVNRRRNQG